jgi:hypothetical protein
MVLRRPVAVAAAAGSSSFAPVDEVVADLRGAGARRVVVASYLLAPGVFHERLRTCGADAVTSPLLHPARVPDLLVELVLARAGLTCDNARFLLQWSGDQRPAPHHAPLLAG